MPNQRTSRLSEPDRIPAATAERLAMYLRELQRLARSGKSSVSSQELGTALGVSAEVIRKDMAAMGHAGRRGVGYSLSACEGRIREVLGAALGQARRWPVLLVGVGSLGRALARYRGFHEQGLDLIAAVDHDPTIVGQRIGGVEIRAVDELEQIVRDQAIELAILAVPAENAPAMAGKLADAGVAGILNFAPVTLPLDPRIAIRNVDLSSELLQVAFAVRRGPRPRV
jgi:redox-sensing transcriptional repressor